MKNFTNNFKQFTSRLSARWLIMALMMLVGTSSAWAANLYIYSTSSSAKAWIWVEGGSNYTGGNWNNRPALSNTTYFESLGNNIYRYKKQTLPSSVSIILTPSGGSPEARIDNLSLSSNKYLSYSGGNTITQVTPSSYTRYVAGGTAGDSGGTDNVFGTRWEAAGATNKMTWDDSKCLFVKEYITNESSSITLTFKITNGTWSSSWPASNKTQSVSSGCRKTTITYNIFTNAVSSTSASSTECCTPSATITEATYNCGETTIHLEGNLTEACGGMYFGWQYKTTSGDDWSTATAIAGHASNNYSTSAKTYELDWTIPNPGTTYYFRAYATPDAKTWYSDRTTKTVKTYKSPTLYTISGSDATLTLSDSEAGYTYTLYNNASPVSNSAKAGTGNALTWTLNDGGTYTVKAKPSESDCDEVLMNGSYTYSPCPAVTTPTLSIVSEPKNNCGTETKGKIQITNYSSFSDCTFTLNGAACTPSSKGEIEVSNSGTYKVIATNDCGSKSAEASVTVSKTTIIAPSTTPEVSLSYPQVAFATNDGSVNINLSIGERGITYYLYKDGAQVANSEKTGENKSLQWTVNESGTYTVKAPNPCDDGGYIAMTGSVKYTCMSNLKLAFEGGKSVFCPGETTNIIVKFDGDGKGDEITNYGKYGWQWEKTNIDYTSVYLSESGVKVPVTIKGDGSIKLGVRSCGTIYSNELTFTVHKAPEAPTVSFSTNPVGQNKNTTLSIASYSADNTYVVYKSADDKVGDDTEVGTYTAPFAVSLAEVGNYYYYAVATSKACTDLVTTSTITKLEVQEAGAKIVQLGDLVLYENDNTDFVPMYVQKDGIVDIDGATKVTGYTWEYSANGTSDWTPCSTGYVANGAGMNNSGDKCNNWRANKVGYYRCMITYDKGSQPSNTLRVTQGTNIKTNKQHIGAQRNLPIISVNTGGNSFPSEPANGYPSAHADDLKAKISVDVKIFNADGTLHYDRKARMNYRGSSSLNFKKKSYAFVTGKEKTKNDKGDVDTGKANLFGLSDGAEDKDWVLYAATPDPSMMRNRLTFDLYQQMRPNDWGVNSKYVELVINGEYMGVYVLMDKITENEKRINITAGDGFIVKFDKTDVADRYVDGKQSESDEKTFKTERTGRKGISTYGTYVDQLFEIEYPEKEDTEDAGGNWTSVVETIKDRFEKFETALANKDYTAVRTLIDYDSWADWFILTEFIKNQDGFRASCIFVYNGGKIEARPLWDQELSFDNRTRMAHGSNSAEDLMIQSNGVYSDCFPAPFWFYGKNATFGTCGNNNGNSGSGTRYSGYLLADPCFVSLVKSKWATYQTGILSANNISGMVSDYATELGNAQTREESRWPYNEATRGTTKNGLYIGYYAGEGDSNYFGYSASKGSITTWATNRSTKLDSNSGLGKAINGLEGDALIFTINPSTIETSPWQQNVITVNAPTGYEYEINFSELTNVGTEVKENGDSYTFKVPRPGEWGTAGNGTAKSVQYTISATIDAEGENACGTQISNTATSVVTLNDVTENCSPEVKP